MFSLNLETTDRPLKVLCLGAHCDDIELGCGGAVLRLSDVLPNPVFQWVVFSATPQRAKEAQNSADRFLAGIDEKRIVIKDFRDSFFPYEGAQIKAYFAELKRNFNPDVIFTHFHDDAHQDHRLIAELTWQTFRDHLIFEYEIPKYDGDLARPNFYVHLTRQISKSKVKIITETFQSQNHNHWFSEEVFLSALRIRGVECNAPEEFAEGFHCRKAVF